MKPIDYRNATFADLQRRIEGQRAAVLRAWEQHGPGTTIEVAARSGVPLLTLRPRTTELVELGFVVMDEIQLSKGAGTYRAASVTEVTAHFQRTQRGTTPLQTELTLR